jgi:oligopeptide/dipeptide ABC transporter ATP-binding protein
MTDVATIANANLVEARDLTVEYELDGDRRIAIEGVSLMLHDGESVGLVGESGSGKTTAALAIAGLLPRNATMTGGEVLLRGSQLPVRDDAAMRPHRWRDIAVVFQGSMHALNPVHRIGDQIAEPMILRLGYSHARARLRVRDLLQLVGIPEKRERSYPHELSGGMRQRTMIAMALACEPAVLIADEPTTALDVLTQAQILALLRDLRSQLRLSMILITHDMSVVANACDRVVMMYSGRVVENAETKTAFVRPRHPYTRMLLETVPDPQGERRIRSIPGFMPNIGNRPSGCAFHPRCPFAIEICTLTVPPLEAVGANQVACHRHAELADDTARSKAST